MRKKVTFYINDEPLVATATEQRQATITYEGPRYLYVEYCSDECHVMAPVHWSDEPEPEVAEERRTIDDCRSIIELDAQDSIFPICVFMPTLYKLSIPDYTEELPDGNTFAYEYPPEPTLDDIYDLKNMEFDPETKDFKEWLYDINDISDDEYVQSIDDAIASANDDINDGFVDESDLPKMTAFIAELEQLKEDYTTGIYGPVQHWKIDFPTVDLNA
jgi:hypothetical protein